MGIDFTEVLRERHKWALEHKKSGGQVMGCYSALVPEEVMWACGFLPIQLTMSGSTYIKAHEYLPPYVCDCSKDIFEQVLDGTYGYLDGLMVAHVCETIRGLAGIWRFHWPDRFVHVFTPPVNSDAGAKRYLKAEILSLADRLSEIGGKKFSEDNLEEAISLYNTNRQLVEQIYEQRGAHPGSIRPEEVVSAVLSGMLMPKPLHNEMLKEFFETLEIRPPNTGTRIILSGLTFENELINEPALSHILEDAGAVVVWDDLASGMRYRLRETRMNKTASPLEILVEGLLGPQTAPTRRPIEHKVREILGMGKRYRAQGVIFLIPKYCDPLSLEISELTNMLKRKDCPSLVLEISGTLSEGQIRTRVEAFLEMISDASDVGADEGI
jgi:benzoyl-CoA reductase/2-hydroxyglutaryl-CoA dehydratase subunit BcrC/BadD/HgdB